MFMNVSPLFQPVGIGPLVLKNRFVMAPMSVHMTEDGSVTDKEIAYTERRAAGGVAMIIVGSVCVRPDGNFGGQLFIENDDRIAGLRRLTDAVHRHDCLIAAQIHHSGRETNKKTSGYQPVAPSPFEPESFTGAQAEYDPPHVLSTEEVREMVECYAQGVRRAKEAGFDMCELHCAHGYLISSFMSPLTNRRTDEYGGSFLGRMRFVTEIIRRSRELVGEEYPISCRIVGDELREGGIDMALAADIARYLEKLGVAALSVSAGMFPFVRTVSNMYHRHGVNAYLAENVRDAVHIPVFAAGQLDRPEVQLEVLEKGKADVVCIGRTLIADPDYPNKLRENRLDDVIWCIACNKGCHDRSAGDRSVKCALNVMTGRETDPAFALTKAEKPARVMVIGGGPAGMQAAADAARRGHAVSLWDDREILGGRLRLAAVPPHKDRYGEACDYLAREVRKLPIDVHLSHKVTLDDVKAEKPDAVILATGSVPFILPVKGIDQDFVVPVDEVLAGKASVGRRVAVIGGGSVGAETAHLLLEQQQREIYILEMREGIGIDLPQDARICLLHIFENSLSMHCMTGSRVTGIGDHAVTLERGGREERLENIDTVVMAVGARPNQSLKQGIEDMGVKVLVIGDAESPRDYVKAIRQGAEAGRAV